jgi:RNA polymerase-binding transcription factor DksA
MAVNIEKYKTHLDTLLDELTKELQTIGIHNPENESDWIAVPEALDNEGADKNVVADRVEEWDERRSIVATLETRYNNITRALKKINEGTYGTCEVCGNEIETERLDANPAARTDKEHMEEEFKLSK